MLLFSVKKTRVWIIASLTLKVIPWGYPIQNIYRPSLSLHYWNLFEVRRILWLWMSGKRNVSVCRGHEFANALYVCRYTFAFSCQHWTNECNLGFFMKVWHFIYRNIGVLCGMLLSLGGVNKTFIIWVELSSVIVWDHFVSWLLPTITKLWHMNKGKWRHWGTHCQDICCSCRLRQTEQP